VGRHWSAIVVLTGLLVLGGGAGARAFDQGAELRNFAKTAERPLYDADYQAQLALQSLKGTVDAAALVAGDPSRNPLTLCVSGALPCAGDPRLYDWGDRYGVVWGVNWVNRNGAVTAGHVWAPLPQPGEARRMPCVVFFNGDLAPEQVYWWLAQLLARHGYLVMTFDPQDHGASDTFGGPPDPLRNVVTQEYAPFEDTDQVPYDAEMAEQAADAVRFFFSTPAVPYLPARTDGRPTDPRHLTPAQAKQQARAAAGLGNAFNPLYRLRDVTRFGIAGHSRGADTVSILGTKDPRVKAIVAYDYLLAGTAATASNPGLPGPPRAPALNLDGDYYYPAPEPYTEAPDPQAKNQGFLTYRAAGVDSMSIAIRGGTHYEFNYAPDSPFNLATLRGIDLAGWYTLAWFDRYLKRERSADRRLLSERWRADAGEAAVDPGHDGNMFSTYFPSRVAVHLLPRRPHERRRVYLCDDLRAGCPGLVPENRDGYPGAFDYLHARGE